MEVKNNQAPRLSYTVAYKGLVVGGVSDYHPEKIDISMTKTIDYIEGETKEQTQSRLDAMHELETLLCLDVESSVMKKVKAIKMKKKGGK